MSLVRTASVMGSSRQNTILLSLFFAGVHFAISFGLFAATFEVQKPGQPVPPMMPWERVASGVLVGSHPLLLAYGSLPFPIRYINHPIYIPLLIGVAVADSLLWGFGAVWLLTRLRRAFARMRPAHQPELSGDSSSSDA